MTEKDHKRDLARLFRDRLARAGGEIGRRGDAGAGGRRRSIDRSTISQFPGDRGARRPNARIVSGCAEAGLQPGHSRDTPAGGTGRPAVMPPAGIF